MIIFGWGRQTFTQLGVIYKNLCSHCHNEDYWVLTRIRTWFTLFFIPIIPYSTEYFLSCPICKYGITLNHEQIQVFKPLAEMNQLLLDGKITNEQYQVAMSQLNKSQIGEIEKSDRDMSSVNDLKFCSNCGTNITSDLKFCGNCGVPTVSK
jgi:hypothetical protein